MEASSLNPPTTPIVTYAAQETVVLEGVTGDQKDVIDEALVLVARRAFIYTLSGSLITVAKDVKIQVEFNPDRVAGHRLIGYENRLLANNDFSNDSVDAGELGASMSVTAVRIGPSGTKGSMPGQRASGSLDTRETHGPDRLPRVDGAPVRDAWLRKRMAVRDERAGDQRHEQLEQIYSGEMSIHCLPSYRRPERKPVVARSRSSALQAKSSTKWRR